MYHYDWNDIEKMVQNGDTRQLGLRWRDSPVNVVYATTATMIFLSVTMDVYTDEDFDNLIECADLADFEEMFEDVEII